jgi:hypothetical protein
MRMSLSWKSETAVVITAYLQNALTIYKNGQIHIPKGRDASLTSDGFLMLGTPGDKNSIIVYKRHH